MGNITVTGAMIIIIGWIVFIEYDHLPESEREKVIDAIKTNVWYLMLLLLMPFGIIVNIIGMNIGSFGTTVVGATMIFVQGIIASFILGKRTRWKGVMLFIIMVVLGAFLYGSLILL